MGCEYSKRLPRDAGLTAKKELKQNDSLPLGKRTNTLRSKNVHQWDKISSYGYFQSHVAPIYIYNILKMNSVMDIHGYHVFH